MDFRHIRLEDVIFDDLRSGRNSVRYGGNTSITFQVPRTQYRISSGKFSSGSVLTPLSIHFPCEFRDFMTSLVQKSNVHIDQPFERLHITDDTLVFDENERLMDDMTPGTIIDASLLVALKGTWSNGVTSGLVMDVYQIKVYDTIKPKITPKVYIDGVSV